jgi:predicted nucleic acid-binding protein
MTCSSFLADDLTPLILDTSVLINLHACSYGEQILAAIPNAFAVSDIVVRELEHETSRTNGEHRFLANLIARQQVRQVALDDSGWQIFEKLTTAKPSLGDGEAATIAIAATGHFRPVIDDAKGQRSAELHLSKNAAAWSLDLLVHPAVQERLGNDAYVEAVYLALRDGRMRIDGKQCDAVVELIGIQRASNCPSLPGFKSLQNLWRRQGCVA